MPFASVGDVDLYFEDVGEGYPLVLCHGGFSDVSEWDPQVDVLSKKYRVVRYDRRGCGRSIPKEVEQLAELWVKDLRALIEYLGLGQVVIGGVSYGGMLVLEYLLEHQQTCKAAVIVSSTASGRVKTGPRSVYFPNRFSEISSIMVPTLVVQAMDDNTFPVKHGEEMVARMPFSELVVLEGGHTINNENPSEFNRVLLEFLGKVVWSN
tara:strand:+ start:475 stop:1098 length:624 start_codon:yes stop_codon:yes gene_type:complete